MAEVGNPAGPVIMNMYSRADIERFKTRVKYYKAHAKKCNDQYKDIQEAINRQDELQTKNLCEKNQMNNNKKNSKKKLDHSNNNVLSTPPVSVALIIM